MKRHLLSALLLVLGVLSINAYAADLVVEESRFDVDGRFSVQVPVPAGTRHAALEVMKSGGSPGWRTLVSTALDGRKARVIFKLPADHGRSALVRGKAGPETSVPVAELNDPELITVIYESPIGEQIKIDFLKDAAAKLKGWASLPRAEAEALLIAWAKSNPLVADASVTEPGGNISIRFTDDDIVVLMAKPRRYGLEGTAASTARMEIPEAPTPGRIQNFGPLAATGLSLPRTKHAISAFSLESTFPSSTATIAGWLRTHKYEVDEYPATPVLTVKGWSSASNPIGVLFWQVHGCQYTRKNGTLSTSIVTREYATDQLTNGPYAAMRGSGQLGLAMADGETLPYYTITGTFIRTNMRFAPNSLVVMDACFGANQDLADAFLAAGCGSYVSWDWMSGPESGKPCRKIFDRLLGMNKEAPISTIKERSFTVDVVSRWMHLRGYDQDPSMPFPNQDRPNAILVWHHRQQNPAHMLRPSIMRILQEAASPGEKFSKYLLEGDFGDDPGPAYRTVKWGGKVMDVLRWDEEDGIVFRIPNPAPVGSVQVIINREFESLSNEVPITEWTVPFTFEHREQGSLKATIVTNVKIRADVHGERYEPEGQVTYLMKPFGNIADCKGTATASGTYSPAAGESYTWSGGSSLVSVDGGFDGEMPPHLIVNSGAFTGAGQTMFFGLSFSGSFTQTYKWTDIDGTVYTETSDYSTDLDGEDFFVPLPKINATTYVFGGGSKTLPKGEATETLSWPSTTPLSKPTAETVR
ncbi:hypothetical protein [Luteolibacter luteus]|uniref:Gingipain domain-containing protein n=1 Tax=Luteolibacter luteus TaxID=2728835 RepID=A0A858RQY8_9BACT|nr:hypothetical protein [Luteolibacter luteus]QJE98808.1 hypothetical protein HHL09_24520 [Luteolibacter luteus]